MRDEGGRDEGGREGGRGGAHVSLFYKMAAILELFSFIQISLCSISSMRWTGETAGAYGIARML